MKAATILFGGLVAVSLVVVALWAWIDGSYLASDAPNPQVMRWAARALAIAAGAGAQVIAMTFVVGRLYAHRAAHDAVRLFAALVCSVSAVSAAALGLAART